MCAYLPFIVETAKKTEQGEENKQDKIFLLEYRRDFIIFKNQSHISFKTKKEVEGERTFISLSFFYFLNASIYSLVIFVGEIIFSIDQLCQILSAPSNNHTLIHYRVNFLIEYGDVGYQIIASNAYEANKCRSQFITSLQCVAKSIKI